MASPSEVRVINVIQFTYSGKCPVCRETDTKCKDVTECALRHSRTTRRDEKYRCRVCGGFGRAAQYAGHLGACIAEYDRVVERYRERAPASWRRQHPSAAERQKTTVVYKTTPRLPERQKETRCMATQTARSLSLRNAATQTCRINVQRGQVPPFILLATPDGESEGAQGDLGPSSALSSIPDTDVAAAVLMVALVFVAAIAEDREQTGAGVDIREITDGEASVLPPECTPSVASTPSMTPLPPSSGASARSMTSSSSSTSGQSPAELSLPVSEGPPPYVTPYGSPMPSPYASLTPSPRASPPPSPRASPPPSPPLNLFVGRGGLRGRRRIRICARRSL